jgi:DNA-binding NarL/FixJ family response regulator
MAEPAGGEKANGVRVLALCGESLLIEGIEASLQDRQGIEVVLVDSSQPGAIQSLEKISPDIIVFDLTPSQLGCVFTFLQSRIDVVLIGLDIDRDLALFLSGEWRKLPTMADLVQVIEAQTK